MMFHRRKHRRTTVRSVLWVMAVGIGMGRVLPSAAHADAATVTPEAQADAALRLLEAGRYGEAIPAAQALIDTAPSDPLAYQVRGTLEMYIGSLDAAQGDFKAAAVLLSDSPTTLYGQGLLDIWNARWGDAGAALFQAGRSHALSDAQQSDLVTMQAYLDYLRGDFDTSSRTMGLVTPIGTDPVRQELAALIAARRDPADGAARLTEFLRTASGVPRVREDEGLRPLFDRAAGLEASVTEPSLRRLYAASLGDDRARSDRQTKMAPGLSENVTLKAPLLPEEAVAAVTFTIDGQLAAMVNTAPYAYIWRTQGVANGRHAIRIEALDSRANIISSTNRQVSVFNAHPGSSGPGLAADPALETRVWNLLRPRPARKVAEWTLSGLLARGGDTAGAQARRTVAAALDLDYQDGRAAARVLLGKGTAEAGLADRSGPPSGLSRGSQSRKWVALTFDDGPNPQKTPALLDALDKADAAATFFVVGSRAEAAPDLVRRMTARGDDVENHSYTHPNMALTAAPLAESEILRTSVVIRALTGRRPRFFRPPGGQRNPAVYRLAGEYGQMVALWTIDALNYEEAGSPQRLTAFVMKRVEPGAIVLMHNGMDSTIAAIPTLVTALRAKGYEIVTLTQMTTGTPTVKAAAVPKPLHS